MEKGPACIHSYSLVMNTFPRSSFIMVFGSLHTVTYSRQVDIDFLIFSTSYNDNHVLLINSLIYINFNESVNENNVFKSQLRL